MAIIETITYECDCCGRQSGTNDFNNGSRCGSGNLTLSGNSGALCYGGDWGGSNYNIKLLLCFECADKVSEYLSTLSKQRKSETE